MEWSILTFGDYKGLSLPQVLFKDPDYFFWALGNVSLSTKVREEPMYLYYRARSIKVPAKDGKE